MDNEEGRDDEKILNEEVREYVEHAQSVIDESPQMDEANTKAAVLRDFLELLGWEIPTNTQLEYSVKVGTRSYKVDYALLFEGTPVAFFEAKGVDTSLSANHREQLATYMKNENVNWGILSNGTQYQFLQRQVVNSNVSVEPLAEYDLQQLPGQVPILRAFTCDAIKTGDSEKIANRISELKTARKTLEEQKEELSANLTEVLTDNVSEAIAPLAESQAKELIDSLVTDIESEIDTSRPVTSRSKSRSPSPSQDGTHESDPTSKSGDSTQNSTTEPWDISGQFVVKIADKDNKIAAVSGTNQNEAMIKTTNYLIEHHGLIDELTIPWIPGRTKAVLNDEPHWDDADPDYKEVSHDYYVDTKLGKSAKKRELRRMAGKVGLSVHFDGDW
ncbi:type I restriction enzyme HsdR N-terminal domain-containing protein [Natronobacterium gregoryi]|uniref:Restriction endonuclease subunit R n=2 Tax=Natronobacterium gregoryi TaxID=44930 RepID=L0AKU8_NATGS|nr:type I restriction enzyme HsdR N-terminal domain-containing protein [Natronobacterium gregoryi]AFZ73802.1 hypothetical protein Natgr_2653 [Natronobacterium gregoryi SP2]ELY65289.1 Restriction endonuclease, type I, EcoRI, R subunit/Type III [Natronobacterium gregoryi SP2]PLK19223.1 restriction endonuclease subunit R [Natronobacterium gregoryi SP2]SFJ56786.1 hypothetical protein SAMN05443661_14015 [Natronobacterium gregoryi]